MGNKLTILNRHLHLYEELFDQVYMEASKGNQLYKLEDLNIPEHTAQKITGPGFTLTRDDTPRHKSYTYSNGIDYFYLSRILNASAIVRIGQEEFKKENILTNPKARVFLRDISDTLNAQLQRKVEKPKELTIESIN